VDDPAGHQKRNVLQHRNTGNVEIWHLFPENKNYFCCTAVLMPGFVLIPMKIIYQFSFLFPTGFTATKSHFAIFSICEIFFSKINSSFITHSEQSTVTNLFVTDFPLSSVFPECVILLFCFLWFPISISCGMSVRILFFSILTFPNFFWSSFEEGSYYISGNFFLLL